MNLDVFRGDGFSLTSLTEAINKVPFYPTALSQSGIFQSSGITTTTFEVEMDSETLALVPSKVRGAPGTPVTGDRRNARILKTLHLPQVVNVQADEVQNLRAFGSESEPETAMNLLSQRMGIGRRRADLTTEWQRVGSMKGKILDADGATVLLDLFGTFGLDQQELGMHLDVDGTKVLGNVMGMKRASEDSLGGAASSGITVWCGSGFFDAFTQHPAVTAAYQYWSSNSFMRSDNRAGFNFGEVTWKEYRGKIGGNPFVEADCAYAVPEGVPDMWVTHYSPANYSETVNTLGLPFYAKMRNLDFDKGVEVELQSNPLSFCSRPDAVVKLYLSSVTT